jgi:hypothetical protein
MMNETMEKITKEVQRLQVEYTRLMNTVHIIRHLIENAIDTTNTPELNAIGDILGDFVEGGERPNILTLAEMQSIMSHADDDSLMAEIYPDKVVVLVGGDAPDVPTTRIQLYGEPGRQEFSGAVRLLAGKEVE